MHRKGDSDRVTVAPEELIKLISVAHPYGMIIAHNHVGVAANPSAADDDFTKQCQIICSMNNVRLYDHIICSGEQCYSYFETGRLDGIERSYSISSILKNGKE